MSGSRTVRHSIQRLIAFIASRLHGEIRVPSMERTHKTGLVINREIASIPRDLVSNDLTY